MSGGNKSTLPTAKVSEIKILQCKKGHVWEAANDSIALSFLTPFVEGVERKVIADTGPLCPYCICDFLRVNCGGFPANTKKSEGSQ